MCSESKQCLLINMAYSLAIFLSHADLTLLLIRHKTRAVMLQSSGLVCRVLACCLCRPAAHSQTNAHILYRQEVHTHTHIPCNKGPTVCGGEVNCLCSVIRMTHQTVINENRMKVLIKGEKCRHEECLQTKMTRSLARIPPLYLAFGWGGERANSYYEINILYYKEPYCEMCKCTH